MVARMILLVVVVVVLAAAIMFVVRSRGTRIDKRKSALDSVFGPISGSGSPSYSELITTAIIGGLVSSNSRRGRGMWLETPTCVLLAARNTAEADGVRSRLDQITDSVITDVRRYMDAQKNIKPSAAYTHQRLMIHVVPNTHGSAQAIAVAGPSPEKDPRWIDLLQKASGGNTDTDYGVVGRPQVSSPTDHGVFPTEVQEIDTSQAMVKVFLRDGELLTQLPLGPGRTVMTIGRGPNNDVSLAQSQAADVSAEHLRLQFRPDGSYVVTNLTTRANGTTLNLGHGTDTPLMPHEVHELTHGDVLSLGYKRSVTVQFHCDAHRSTSRLEGTPTE